MKRKITSVFMTAFLLLGLFAGCADSGIRDYEGDAAAEATADAAPEVTEAPSFDLAAAYSFYEPDQLVATIDGLELLWDEYFFYLSNYVSAAQSIVGEITDWETPQADLDNMSVKEYVQDTSKSSSSEYKAFEARALELGAELTQEDKEQIRESWASLVNHYVTDGPDEADEDAETVDIIEELFLTRRVHDGFHTVDYLLNHSYELLYGEKGENVSDEEALSYIEDNGYIFVKQILLTNSDDSGADLPDEELTEKRETAEEILRALDETSVEELDEKFVQLIEEYSEDTSHSGSAEGFAFQNGQMVAEFEDAVNELEELQFTEIVETSYGYHIVLKIAPDIDMVAGFDSNYQEITFRMAAANQLFSAMLKEWAGQAEIVVEDEFIDLDLAAMFKYGD